MISNQAWKRHGCYVLGSEQYFNMPLERALFGCHDDWNALDHFDPTTDSRLLFAQFHTLRQTYGALQDGFNLVQRGNWTYYIERPGSNGTGTEMGLWSVSRSELTGYQTVGGTFRGQVWLLFTNENRTQTYTFDCKSTDWISTPYVSGTTVRNLFSPFESYVLQDSQDSFQDNSRAPWTGCLPSITMDPYGFKALVPVDQWSPPRPVITKFTPGHDYRALVTDPNASNATTLNIGFEFNVPMASCDAVSKAITYTMASSGKGGNPTVTNVRCGAMTGTNASPLAAAPVSAWSWNATLTNVPDGVLTITVNNAPAAAASGTNGTASSTGVITFEFFIIIAF